MHAAEPGSPASAPRTPGPAADAPGPAPPRAPAPETPAPETPAAGRPGGRRALAWGALGAILAGALALRLWGLWQGLPYAYNADENAHFVPRAIGMFGHDLNPNYFANPPAFTYVLHFIFAVWFGGRAGVSHEFALYPGDVFAVARVAAALLGVAALWLLYLCGARLFGRAVGLLAAALEGVAFLPVFYSHLALNDVPTLAPLTLSLVGSAGILRRGRTIDYLIAGVGLGLGCATKYTAGIVLVPLVAAGAIRYLDEAGRGRGGPGRWGVGAPVGLVLAGVAAVGAFVVADPYALLDFHAFHAGLVHQSTVSSESQGKLGAPRESGIAYYLWSFTWGLGWIPAIAAAGGAVSVWWRDRRAALLLVPAPLLFLAFMGLQSRYYGRWLMPIFPIACLLAALFTLQGAGALARGARRLGAGGSLTRALGAGLAVAGAAALLAQGVIYSVHSDVVLARADTRNLMRAWMVAHVPANSRVVVEPVVPDAWVQDLGHPLPGTSSGDRWIKYSSLRGVIAPDGALAPEHSYVVSIEDYERTLAPALIDWYERGGYCWVLSGSTQSGRAFADPRAVPRAIAYYRELRRRATVAHAISPLTPGSGSVPFGFDWTFDYYPLSYARPGPEMVLYRLHGGLCG